MQCSYDVTTNNPDGSVTNTICLGEAKVDGLCYKCAYEQLQAKLERLEDVLMTIQALHPVSCGGCPTHSLACEEMAKEAEQALKNSIISEVQYAGRIS